MGIAQCDTLRTEHTAADGSLDWDLSADEQRELISLLAEVFGGRSYGPNNLRRPGICAYCERLCDNRGPKDAASYNEVEHFRPRKHFNDLTFDWNNLMYACHRCNKEKGDQFPGKTVDPYVALGFAENDYIEPTEHDGYVNPKIDEPTNVFCFTPNGAIEAEPAQDTSFQSKALRTIHDLNLANLEDCENRQFQFFMVYAAIRRSVRSGESILRQFTSGASPYSSYIGYARSEGWFDDVPEPLQAFMAAQYQAL